MYGHLVLAISCMVVRKIVRKKKKNETEDALNKVICSNELEVAAIEMKIVDQRKEL